MCVLRFRLGQLLWTFEILRQLREGAEGLLICLRYGASLVALGFAADLMRGKGFVVSNFSAPLPQRGGKGEAKQ